MAPLLRAAFAGGERERARLHGELLRAKIEETGIVAYYRSYCRRFVPPDSPIAAGFVELMHAGFARRLSPAARESAEGFAAGVGISAEEARRGLVMPDALNVLAGLARGRARLPGLGCTSLAVWGPYTSDGRMLYGRNLDFCGVGVWDRHPLIALHRPDRGLSYVSITTAGCAADGITGMNAEGLTVAIHQHFTSDVVLISRARPILDLASEILRTARGIENAVELCARHPTTSGWTLVLTHWKERRACAVERAGARMSRHDYRDGLCVRANGYEDSALRACEFPYPAMRASSDGRAERARVLAEAGRGALDVRSVAAALAERGADGEHAVFAQGIAQPNNLTSVVFDGERGDVWVADGAAPVNGGAYRRVSLWEEGLSREAFEVPMRPARRKAELAYAAAFARWEAGAGARAALPSLDEAVAGSPRDSYFRLVRGFLRLRAGAAELAEEDLAAGVELPDIDHRRAAAALWLARARDARGRRKQALSAYGLALELGGGEERLLAAAHRGRHAPYDVRGAERVLPDFNLGDTYSY